MTWELTGNAEADLRMSARQIVLTAGFLFSELPKVHRQALWDALLGYPPMQAFREEMAEDLARLALRHVPTAMQLEAQGKQPGIAAPAPTRRAPARRRKKGAGDGHR